MMLRVVVTLRPARVTVAGHRIHHFWVGLAIVISDLRDWRVWISDLWRHS